MRAGIYAMALLLVCNRHSKYALVDLVNWLLCRVEDAEISVRELRGALRFYADNSPHSDTAKVDNGGIARAALEKFKEEAL